MSVRPPHFILFSESSRGRPATSNEAAENRQAEAPEGRWHFAICTPDGAAQLDVAEREQEASQDRLDLLAVVRGLEALDQPSRVTLVTSSGYVHRGLRFGLAAWRQNGWQWERFGQMVPIKNRDLWQRIDRAMEFHQVECRFARVDTAHDDLSMTKTHIESQVAESVEPNNPIPTEHVARNSAQRSARRRELGWVRRVVQWLWPVRSHGRLFAALP